MTEPDGRRIDDWSATSKVASNPDTPGECIARAKLLVEAGDTDQAEALLRQLIAESTGNYEAYLLLCRLYLSVERWQDAIEVCRGPTNARLRTILAHELIDADRPYDALEVIESARALASDDSTWFRLEFAAGSALDAAGLEEEAIEYYNRAALLRPDAIAVLQRITTYDREQGRWPQNRRRLLELGNLVAPRLPPTLAEGLRGCWRQARASSAPTPALAWAWEHADHHVWNQKEWLTAARWGEQAHKVMRSWWRWAPERADEILSMVEKPDLTPLQAALATGRGCLLACAHVGPIAAGVEFLQDRDLPFVTVGFAGSERVVDDGRDRRITITSNRIATTRAVINSLNAGDLVAWSVDSPVGATVTIDLLGHPLRLVAVAPKLSRRYASASFWCQALWRGDRIVIELERLPDPVENESDADWTTRWYRAYLSCLERVVRGDPRNLLGRAGMWLNFAPVRRFGAAQALERRWTRGRSGSASHS